MLRIQSEGPVLRITLSRPEVRNAFNDELIAAQTCNALFVGKPGYSIGRAKLAFHSPDKFNKQLVTP